MIRFYAGNLWTLLTCVLQCQQRRWMQTWMMDPQKLIVLPGLEVSKAKKAVQDIRVWSQCFALYVAVPARKFPDTVPDLMAYQLLIIQTHWDYEDPAWQMYDEAFRDKAAATRNRKWSSLDPHLFNKICAGRARKVGLDASALPMARGAGYSPQGPPPKKPARELGRPWGGKFFQPRNFRSKMCWDWNQGACKYNPRKYRYISSDCGRRHPQMQCSQNEEVVAGAKRQPVTKGGKGEAEK